MWVCYHASCICSRLVSAVPRSPRHLPLSLLPLLPLQPAGEGPDDVQQCQAPHTHRADVPHATTPSKGGESRGWEAINRWERARERTEASTTARPRGCGTARAVAQGSWKRPLLPNIASAMLACLVLTSIHGYKQHFRFLCGKNSQPVNTRHQNCREKCNERKRL